MSQVNAEEETRPAKCEKHGNYEAKIVMLMDKEIVRGCPDCTLDYEAERKEEDDRNRKREEKEKINELFKGATIPKRFAEKAFDNYIASGQNDKYALTICKKYAENFDSRLKAGGGLVLCGKPGTGKTHLAAAIANHAINEFSRSVVFSSVISAMRRVKSTYSRDSEEKEGEAVKAFTKPDLLILDEVGVQFGSDAEKMILFEIVNIRYQDMKPTILISNLSLEDLKEYIGERVVDRMYEGGGAVIAFDWESYRSKL